MNDPVFKKLLDQASEPFRASAYYDPSGDCIEFFLSNEPFEAKRLDKWVTVYFGLATGEVVGSLIKDVHCLLAKYPGLNIEIDGGKVKIAHMLRAPAWSTGDDVARKTYKDIIDRVDSVDHLTADLQLV